MSGVSLDMFGMNDFDSSTVDTGNSYDNLPPAEYTVVITDSITKQTKTGTGSYLELTMEVIDGEFQGRKIWDRLNLNNPNPMTVEIARKTLAQISKAVGIFGRLSNSSELHDKPMTVKVTYKNDDQRLRYIEGGAVPGAQRAATPAARTTAPAGPAPRPWERRA